MQNIDEIFPSVDRIDLYKLWPSYDEDIAIIKEKTKTNIKNANLVLDTVLNISEKNQLEKLFFDKRGWYKEINNEGMIKLKLAAMSLQLTSNVFTFDSLSEKDFLSYVKSISYEEQVLNMQCYLKQKAVTYYTLQKYLTQEGKKDDNKILLYRGIRYSGELKEYYFTGLESWTTNPDIAERFAKNGGYVIFKEYPINRIFSGNRSTFKNKQNNLYMHNGFFVRREHEMIVENSEKKLAIGSNCYKVECDEYI